MYGHFGDSHNSFSSPSQFMAPMSTVPTQVLPNAWSGQHAQVHFDTPNGQVEMAAPLAGGVVEAPQATRAPSGTVPIAIEGGSEGVIQDAQGGFDLDPAQAWAWWQDHGSVRIQQLPHDVYAHAQPYVDQFHEQALPWLQRSTCVAGMAIPNWLIAGGVVLGGACLLRK